MRKGRKRKTATLSKGDKIDKLTLIDNHSEIKRGRTYIIWNCLCDCGGMVMISEDTLKKKTHYHSCGCVPRENLIPGNTELVSKAGRARAEKRNKDGVNVDMLFRNKTISTNTSGVQGVSWSGSSNKWHVYVGYKKRRATLGYFDTLEEAKKVRELGLKAVENGTFEDFFYKVRGKVYNETYKVSEKKGRKKK